MSNSPTVIFIFLTISGESASKSHGLVGESHGAGLDTSHGVGVELWGLEGHSSSAFSAKHNLLGVDVVLIAKGVIDELEVSFALVGDSPLVSPGSVLDGGDSDLGASWEE